MTRKTELITEARATAKATCTTTADVLADRLEAAEAELTRRDTFPDALDADTGLYARIEALLIDEGTSASTKADAVQDIVVGWLRDRLAAAPVSLEAVKAEAHRRYSGDTIIDDTTGEPTSFDDWGYAECQRAAFIAGVEWRPVPTEGTKP